MRRAQPVRQERRARDDDDAAAAVPEAGAGGRTRRGAGDDRRQRQRAAAADHLLRREGGGAGRVPAREGGRADPPRRRGRAGRVDAAAGAGAGGHAHRQEGLAAALSRQAQGQVLFRLPGALRRPSGRRRAARAQEGQDGGGGDARGAFLLFLARARQPVLHAQPLRSPAGSPTVRT